MENEEVSTEVVFNYLLPLSFFFKITFLENYDRYATQTFRVD